MRSTVTNSVNNAVKTRGRPFAKGNPGRPRGTRDRRAAFAEALMLDDVEGVVTTLLAAAKAGDTAAAKLILDRVLPLRRGRPVVFEMPEINDAASAGHALAAITKAVSNGNLTPEEAQAVATVVQTRRRALETIELEARIAALEQAAGQ